MSLQKRAGALKLAAVLCAALAMAACAKSPVEDLGAATPGSHQDFTVNVGDRVFFESDFE